MANLDLRSLTKNGKAYVGKAELVDTLKAGVTPSKELVVKYYTGSSPIPDSVFAASNTDRLIYQKPNGSYIVIPDTLKNRSCIN